MKALGKLFWSVTMIAVMTSMVVACGRKSSDDVRAPLAGNLNYDTLGVASTSTLEGLSYTMRVARIYRNLNGYQTGYGTGIICDQNSPTLYTAIPGAVYIDLQVNGRCKTLLISNGVAPAQDADLGVEVSMACADYGTCDTVYLNIVGRNPAKYSANVNGGYVALPGQNIGYYGTNWTLTTGVEVKQIGIMKSMSQDKILAAIESQTLYEQRLRPTQLGTSLQQLSQNYNQ